MRPVGALLSGALLSGKLRSGTVTYCPHLHPFILYRSQLRKGADVPDEQITTEIEVRDEGPMLVATVVLAHCEPGAALTAFTQPAMVASWWRGELSADLVPGGDYTVRFPAIPATLTGKVVAYAPGESLEFSWAWDGEADIPPSTVVVTAAPAPGEPGHGSGETVLTIEHGPHAGDEAGQAARAEHREGWQFFLPRLAQAVQGP